MPYRHPFRTYYLSTWVARVNIDDLAIGSANNLYSIIWIDLVPQEANIYRIRALKGLLLFIYIYNYNLSTCGASVYVHREASRQLPHSPYQPYREGFLEAYIKLRTPKNLPYRQLAMGC